MTDKELLEAAAKAAGHVIGDEVNQYSVWDGAGLLRRNCNGTSTIWNPLADDGDAFRLAVKLGIFGNTGLTWQFMEAKDCESMRRIIVEAAATSQ